MNRTTSNKNSQTTREFKIIKKYGNRKLYDTDQSSYVVLGDIAKMLRNNEKIRVIENHTGKDVTITTLLQIIFIAEKKAPRSAPEKVLRKIITAGDGSLSHFLSDLGLFKPDSAWNKEEASTLEDKIVASTNSTHDIVESNEPPELPNANKSLDSTT